MTDGTGLTVPICIRPNTNLYQALAFATSADISQGKSLSLVRTRKLVETVTAPTGA